MRARRVLIVEDEFLVAMMLEEVVRGAGHEVVGPALDIASARSLARDAAFDAAVLDVNLGGDLTFEVAGILGARSLPYFLVTGYGLDGVPDAYRQMPVLQKPFREQDLLRLLAEALADRR